MNVYAIVGLGYVGLGLAVALSRKFEVFGYDINTARIQQLLDKVDINKQVTTEELQNTKLKFTANLEDLRQANIYIVTVSTPAYWHEIPDLDPLIKATESLASIIKPGDTIIYESTVYPGTTDDVCIPKLEEISKLFEAA